MDQMSIVPIPFTFPLTHTLLLSDILTLASFIASLLQPIATPLLLLFPRPHIQHQPPAFLSKSFAFPSSKCVSCRSTTSGFPAISLIPTHFSAVRPLTLTDIIFIVSSFFLSRRLGFCCTPLF